MFSIRLPRLFPLPCLPSCLPWLPGCLAACLPAVVAVAAVAAVAAAAAAAAVAAAAAWLPGYLGRSFRQPSLVPGFPPPPLSRDRGKTKRASGLGQSQAVQPAAAKSMRKVRALASVNCSSSGLHTIC